MGPDAGMIIFAIATMWIWLVFLHLSITSMFWEDKSSQDFKFYNCFRFQNNLPQDSCSPRAENRLVLLGSFIIK
jgi:hypothetical protein